AKELDTLKAHSMKHNRLECEYQYLASLKCPPRLADTLTLQSIIADLVDAESEFQRETERFRALENLNSPPLLENVSSLANTVGSLDRAYRGTARWSKLSEAVKDLRLLPTIDDVQPLESLCGELSREEKNHRKLNAKVHGLRLLNDPPFITD